MPIEERIKSHNISPIRHRPDPAKAARLISIQYSTYTYIEFHIFTTYVCIISIWTLDVDPTTHPSGCGYTNYIYMYLRTYVYNNMYV